MKGTSHNHTGVYLGNGKVFEDTTGWGKCKAIISDISKDGTRSLNRKKNLRWTYHGKLNFINYINDSILINQVSILQDALNNQWNCGLAVDGKFGPLTTRECRKHNLYRGIKAEIMVKWLQTRLEELNFSVGLFGIDGKFGPDTLRAVKKFQKDYGLKVDGIVGNSSYQILTR